MTNRIDQTIQALQQKNKKVLSPYITAGDPSPELTVPLMHALVEGGANILEIGIPFSDPMAEGPVIQHAMERALEHRIGIDDVFEMIATFRQTNQQTPIVVMGYVNPIEMYDYEAFAKNAEAVGIDGTILVDMPPEESDTILSLWHRHNLYPIFLCSPTTTDARLKTIAEVGKGYLYYVSLKGVTGSASIAIDEVQKIYQQRKMQVSLPLMVGFGIKTPEMAANISFFADGVIVGAALIELIFEAWQSGSDPCKAAMTLMADMRQAMNALEK